MITLEEWIAKYGSADGFYEHDLDGDGVIDANEFRAKETRKDPYSAPGMGGGACAGIIGKDPYLSAYRSAMAPRRLPSNLLVSLSVSLYLQYDCLHSHSHTHYHLYLLL